MADQSPGHCSTGIRQIGTLRVLMRRLWYRIGKKIPALMQARTVSSPAWYDAGQSEGEKDLTVFSYGNNSTAPQCPERQADTSG
jgi:hypothetical protein